jgi:hypothetical protein
MTHSTNYAGIDYSGPGSTVNRDAETGIRYGIISQNRLNGDALNDVYTNGDDPLHRLLAQREQMKAAIAAAIESAIEDYAEIDSDEARRMAVEIADSDCLIMHDCDESGPYAYSDGDLNVQTTSNNDLWVFKSPYFTHAQFCSPCVPGAGNLDTYCAEGPKTYCLGHDWFEGGIAPYPVFDVATGLPVAP